MLGVVSTVPFFRVEEAVGLTPTTEVEAVELGA